MQTLILRFNPIRLKISTNYGAYYAYLSRYFEKILVKSPENSAIDIEVRVLWEDKGFKDHCVALGSYESCSLIGANTWLDKDRIVTTRKVGKKRKVIFDVSLKSNHIKALALIQKKTFKDFMRYSVLGKPQEEWFFTLTYPCLYYPLFWFLEYFKDTYPLHASAVGLQGKGVIICGLEGMGKTSLALSLLKEAGSSFLSDNLIFYDRNKVYPCYELIRLHKHENENLWKDIFEKIGAFKTLKDFYQPRLSWNAAGLIPKVFIFPEFSSHFFIRELSVEEAARRAILLSYLPAELNTYVEYRNLYHMLDLDFYGWLNQYEVLQGLLKGTHRCLIGMPKSDGLEVNANKVRDYLKGI